MKVFVMLLLWSFVVTGATITEDQSLKIYSATTIVEKSVYRSISTTVVAVLILESGWFKGKDIEKYTSKKLEYFEEFGFPESREGFYKALKNVPLHITHKPYAIDPEFINKVRTIEWTLRKGEQDG